MNKIQVKQIPQRLAVNLHGYRRHKNLKVNPNTMKVFVSNLHPSIKEDELLGLFQEFGPCKSILVIRNTHHSQHPISAIIDMCKKDDVDIVIQFLNGDLVRGLPLSITNFDQEIMEH